MLIFTPINANSMDNNVITTIDVEDFKDFSHMIDYVDEDVVAARNLEDISYNNITIRLNFFLIISCVEGWYRSLRAKSRSKSLDFIQF